MHGIVSGGGGNSNFHGLLLLQALALVLNGCCPTLILQIGQHIFEGTLYKRYGLFLHHNMQSRNLLGIEREIVCREDSYFCLNNKCQCDHLYHLAHLITMHSRGWRQEGTLTVLQTCRRRYQLYIKKKKYIAFIEQIVFKEENNSG